ncbi:short-chain collagen C4-like [Saccostrea echinata]|uniref:short-chain collagen C4-like n=1 Tax=Saccostrea echinata TaxID=191078 RepID=UPI002A80B3AC|nr:short-chain collagen C4-like [Saccostrea echinata]
MSRAEKRILLDDPTLIRSELHTLKNEVQSLRSQILDQSGTKTGEGQTYIIWGKKTCPALNGTHTVYSGISSGRQYTNAGSGSNTLCLPHNPDPAPVDYPKSFQGNNPSFSGSLHGAEYQFTYRNIAIDDDVPCAVCMVTNAASTLMVPAKTSCPAGWTVQYTGVLTSGSDASGHYGTDYLCLDENPEYMTEGARMQDYNGKLFYPVHAVCGSLPCPPYKNQQLISCVVCSI